MKPQINLIPLIGLFLLNLGTGQAQVIGTGSNPNEVGEYNSGESAIINNAPSTGVGGSNSIDGEFNFLGGSSSSVGTNANLRNSFAYGLNNDLTAGTSGTAIALGEDLDLNVTSAYAIGEGMVINSGSAIGIGSGHSINGSPGVAIGDAVDINNSKNYGFGETIDISSDNAIAIGFGSSSSTRLQDVGQNSIILGLDANNILNIFNNTNGNPTVGINRTSVANTSKNIDLTINGRAENTSGTWDQISDKRLKKNIKPFKDGLKKLMKIEPKWYQYNGKLGLPEGNNQVGIIAQEMKDIAPYMIYENDNGYLGYNPNPLRYLLVNAVQKQQKIIKEEKQQRKEKIQQLEQRIAKLEAQVKANHGSENAATPKVKPENQKTVELTNESLDNPVLYQNIPNPFRDETVIKYYLPDNSRNAKLLIASAKKGTLLKRINLENKGKGQVNLQTNNLEPGTYTYTLLVNGEQVQSRKMVIKH